MGRKHIKHVIPFLTVFVILYGVFCPSLFYGKTSTLLHTYNLGSGTGWTLSFTDNNLIPSSVYCIEDRFAGGNVKAYYQFGEWYSIFYTPVVLDYAYFMLQFDLLSCALNITGQNLTQVSFVVGTLDEFQNGDYHTLCYRDLTGMTTATGVFPSDMSYISEYGEGTSVYCGLIFKGYIYHTDTSNSVYPSASGSFDIDMDVYGIDIDGAYNAIYELLGDLYYDNLDILAELQSIDSSNSTISSKLSTLLTYTANNYNQLLMANNNIVDIENLLRGVSNKLDSIQGELEDVNSELDTQTSILGSISSGVSNFYDAFLEYIGLGSDTTAPEAPDTSGVQNQIQMEQELLGKDTSAAVNNLNITIDASANGFIWNTIDKLLTSNAIVFGGFLSLLTIGVIKLFFGR